VSRWLLTYDAYEPSSETLREALCTLGNGYFATRGAAPESTADGTHYPGTYLAGCYDRLTSEVDGHAVENEDLVNAPNWLPLTFRIDGGDWFTLDAAAPLSYWQELDLRRGVLTRTVRVQDDMGRTTLVTQRRLVSMDDPHLAALETTIVPEDWSGRLEIRSALDGRVVNAGVARYQELSGEHLHPDGQGAGGEAMWLRTRTATSQIAVAVAARTRVIGAEPGRTARQEDARVTCDLVVEAAEGVPTTVEKVAAVFTSKDRAISECGVAARAHVLRAEGFDELLERHALSPAELEDLLTRLGYDYDPALITRTIGYYLPRTSHGSTLSALIHAWLLARTDGDQAWRLFRETLRGDVQDVQHGTTAEGIHLGAMAGTVDLVQRCFAGLEPRGDTLCLNPRLPAGLNELRFTLRYRGHWGLEVTCRPDRLRVALRPGAASPIQVAAAGRTMSIEPGTAWEVPLTDGRADQGPLPEGPVASPPT
jgi:trehalose/maltose hydrolase-like predicted phosphorylase